jgi:hypothetical protein
MRIAVLAARRLWVRVQADVGGSARVGVPWSGILAAPHQPASAFEERSAPQDVVVHLGIAEPTVNRREILVKVVVGVCVTESNFKEHPAGVAEEPLMEIVRADREHWRIDRPCLTVAAVLATSRERER